MREREAIQEPLANPKCAEQQIEASIRRISGNKVFFHHTVLRPDFGITYGGLHETRAGAVAAKEDLVRKAKGAAWSRTRMLDGNKVKFIGFSQSQANALAATWESQAEVVELKEGEQYHPWGKPFDKYTHGVDDGTHGSEEKKSLTVVP